MALINNHLADGIRNLAVVSIFHNITHIPNLHISYETPPGIVDGQIPQTVRT